MKNETGDKTPQNENEHKSSKNEAEDKTSKNEKDVDLADKSKEEILDVLKEARKDAKSSIAQKKRYRSKVNKLKEEIEKFSSEDSDESSNEDSSKSKPDDSNIQDRLDRIEFMSKNRDLDSEDYKNIESVALGKGISLEKAKEDPLIKTYLKNKEEKVAQEQSTPSPSSRSTKIGNKSISDMSDDEIKDKWSKITKQSIRDKKKK